jgi:hypothetical protein
MTKLSALLLGIAILAASFANSTAAEDVLHLLSSKLSAIRSSASSERVALEHVPEVRGLVGIDRVQLLSSLGQPDSCLHRSPEDCMSLPTWVYAFVHLPPGSRGGGPELYVSFDQHSVVQVAQWKLSR